MLICKSPEVGQVLYLPIKNIENANLIDNVPLNISINPKNGSIFQPAVSSAGLEESMVGPNGIAGEPFNPIVFRSLPNEEWIVFNEETTLAMSANVYNQL